MESERRASGVEFRMTRGERAIRSPSWSMAISRWTMANDSQPGAFGVEPRAALNIQHDRSLVVLQADEITCWRIHSAGAFEIRAELPAHQRCTRSLCDVVHSADFLSNSSHAGNR